MSEALIIFLIIFLVTLVISVLFLPLPFALNVVFLLNILKANPVIQQELVNSELIAAQIILAPFQIYVVHCP